MNYQLSKSQKEIQKAAREFAKGEFDKDLAMDYEKNGIFPEKIRTKAAELGFIGIHYPDQYDGGDLGVVENVIVADEFCTKNSSLGMGLILSGFGSEALLRFGSEELKNRFLPEIVEGNMLSGVAFSESASSAFIPDHDLTAIQTTAEKDGDEWIVNGQKNAVINGGAAGFYIIICRIASDDGDHTGDNSDDHSGDHSKGPSKGISMFLVEADRKGVMPSNRRNKLGMRMTPTSDLTFENVRIPTSNLIGKEGQGLRQVRAFYDEIRILTAAMALGTARGAFTVAIDYVKQREQFGRKIGQFQVIRHKLADMAMELNQAELMTYSAATLFDLGKRDAGLFAMARLNVCRTALNVSSEAIQILGGYGYMTEYEVERAHRDAKALMLFAENTMQLKNTIAVNIIGKIK